jgi:CHASE2 domain-containing sensor protein
VIRLRRRPAAPDAEQLAEHAAKAGEAAARAVEQLPREDCGHNVRASCPKCARREALGEAERAIRAAVPCTG